MNEISALGMAFFLLGSGSPPSASPPSGEVLTLESAIARSLVRAPEIAVARSEAEISESSARVAEAAFSPELWLSTTPGYSSGLPVAVAGRAPAIASVELRQTLFSPEFRSDSLEARGRASQAYGVREAAMASTVGAVVDLYARCWKGQERLAAANREFEARDALVASAEALVREGRKLKIDLERAELEAARARQKIQAVGSDLDLDSWELRRRIGWPGGAPIVLAEDPLARLPECASDDELSVALARDPESLALDGEIAELDRAVRSLEPRWSPEIAAEAQYARLSRANGYDEFYKKFKADDWSVGVSVAVPLWNKSRLARQVRMHDQSDKARAMRVQRQWNLERDLRAARAELDRAGTSCGLALREQALANESLKLARLLRAEGRGEADGVERETISLAESEDAVARARYGLFAARLRLVSLRGELTARFLASNQPP